MEDGKKEKKDRHKNEIKTERQRIKTDRERKERQTEKEKKDRQRKERKTDRKINELEDRKKEKQERSGGLSNVLVEITDFLLHAVKQNEIKNERKK